MSERQHIEIPELTDFAAIDFESANGEMTSACSVGIVIVRDREIKDSFYSLIKRAQLLLLLEHQDTRTMQKRHRRRPYISTSMEQDIQTSPQPSSCCT